jgi:phage terminase large subunit-like protein
VRFRAAVANKRSVPRRRKTPAAAGPSAWWGEGPPPHKRWGPGVTIEIPAKWSKERERWESPDGRYYFDVAAADKTADFFPTMLEHHIGEFNGVPFELLPYQRFLVRTAFGWKRAVDGLRRFVVVFCAVPKKNGKSPLGSGLGLYLAAFDDEPGAEVYAAAADKAQAGIVFKTSKIMVERSSALASVFSVTRDSIALRDSTEFYQVLSADVPTKHGLRPHGIIFDELHAQPSRDLYDTLHRGTANRRQPLTVMLTTAGDDEESFGFEQWEYARRVIKGEIEDEALLPMIFEAGPKDDWKAEPTWKKCNPGYGITIKKEYFERESLAALNEPRKLNSFLQLHTNRWVNRAVAWMPVEWWDACDSPLLEDAKLADLPCTAGIDMAQKIDLAAFVVTVREPLADAVLVTVPKELQAAEDPAPDEPRTLALNYRLHVIPFFWLPEDTVRDREREGFTSYRHWAEMGLLTITEGAMIDADRIFRDVRDKILPRFPLLKEGLIGYDPAFATDLACKLRDRGGLKIFEVLQNYTHLTEPCYAFEALVKAHRIVHGGHAVLRWNAENVAVRRDDAERIRPVKPKTRGGRLKKIDGIVATLMGLKAHLAMPEPPARSIYDERCDGPAPEGGREVIDGW